MTAAPSHRPAPRQVRGRWHIDCSCGWRGPSVALPGLGHGPWVEHFRSTIQAEGTATPAGADLTSPASASAASGSSSSTAHGPSAVARGRDGQGPDTGGTAAGSTASHFPAVPATGPASPNDVAAEEGVSP